MNKAKAVLGVLVCIPALLAATVLAALWVFGWLIVAAVAAFGE